MQTTRNSYKKLHGDFLKLAIPNRDRQDTKYFTIHLATFDISKLMITKRKTVSYINVDNLHSLNLAADVNTSVVK